MRKIVFQLLLLATACWAGGQVAVAQQKSAFDTPQADLSKTMLRWDGTQWVAISVGQLGEAGTAETTIPVVPEELVAHSKALAQFPRTPYFRDGLANRTFHSDILTEDYYDRYNGVNRYMPFYGVFNPVVDPGGFLLTNVGLGLLSFGAGVPVFGPPQTTFTPSPQPEKAKPAVDPYQW